MTPDIDIGCDESSNESNDKSSDRPSGEDTEKTPDQKTAWYVYILRCADNSLYTGVTLDVTKRLDEHNGLISNGAKYTRARRPVELVYQEESASRSDACKREYAIKSLSKAEKESLLY